MVKVIALTTRLNWFPSVNCYIQIIVNYKKVGFMILWKDTEVWNTSPLKCTVCYSYFYDQDNLLLSLINTLFQCWIIFVDIRMEYFKVRTFLSWNILHISGEKILNVAHRHWSQNPLRVGPFPKYRAGEYSFCSELCGNMQM